LSFKLVLVASQAFLVTTVKLWNALSDIVSVSSVESFLCHLKSLIFLQFVVVGTLVDLQ